MTATIHVPDVCERDIDLLLLEEFVASADFRSWFLSQIGGDSAASLSDARRSVRTESGESDLELTFQESSGTLKVLIENKVDAAFQLNQPQRYVERASEYRKSGNYGEVVTVVMAPQVYFGEEPENYGFDARITYETVLGWFSASERASPRTDYKLTLLRAAIDRGRSGWQLVPHPNVGQFWRSYWQLAEQIARQLSMPVPKSEIPAGSHFIVFRPAALPANVKLKHKVGYGHVDLEFREMGDRLAEMERLYGAALPTGARIEKAAKSAVVRTRVDAIDITRADFAANEAVVREGIETAASLLDWYTKMHPSPKANGAT
jgi:hypothetical protein